MSRTPHLLVASHERSGTHLTIDALRNNFSEYAAPLVNLDRLLPNHDAPLSPSEMRELLAGAPRVVKTHMPHDYESRFETAEARALVGELLENSRRLYVYRDGRDVLTSLYYYVSGYQPATAKQPFGAFIRSPNDLLGSARSYGHMDRVTFWRHHLESWLDAPRTIRVAYEDLFDRYQETLERIAEAIRQPLPRQVVTVVRERGKPTDRPTPLQWLSDKIYERFMTHVRGIEHTSVDFRRGGHGGYRELFDPSDLRYFDQVAGDLMTRCGYEPSPAGTG